MSADCGECDFRITHVPARNWPAGSKRPIYEIRNSYPRYAENNGVHGPDYSMELIDRTIYPWKERQPIGSIDQVPHTFAYTLGTYGIQNEKQVSIGESTCSAVFTSRPVYDKGNATLAMEALTEIALERCASARCAVLTMGSLAEKHGFYGPEWGGDPVNAQDEAGEGLTVSDPDETWVFHILPDDTGKSAIWVAQKIPDDHIAAVANQFTITTIDMDDSEHFLGSSNIHRIALEHRLWDPARGPFSFASVYGNDRKELGFACTRRVWRVFSLAAPSLPMSGYTNGLATFGFGPDFSEPFPVSVRVDKPLSVQDVMNINRDQFEGTSFDLTRGLDAGPFGDPMRFPPRGFRVDPVEGINRDQYNAGLGFQRPISLWRTAYSSLTQSRRHLPDEIGAVTWIAPYGPHFSTFVPVYASAPTAPPSLKLGTLYKFDERSNWWIHCLTGNYLSRWYSFTIVDVKAFQQAQEEEIFSSQTALEESLLELLMRGEGGLMVGTVAQSLSDWQAATASRVLEGWTSFFYRMVGKYRDMVKVVNEHAETYVDSYTYLTVPRSWLESVGYWGAPFTPPPGSASPLPVQPINVPSLASPALYQAAYPRGLGAAYPWPFSYITPVTASTSMIEEGRGSWSAGAALALGAFLGAILALLGMKIYDKFVRSSRYVVRYQSIA